MHARPLLEDFAARALANDRREGSGSIGEVSFEPDRVDAYEQGYKAGWDDAIKAQCNERETIRADLACNLQELTFTYAEAKAKIQEQMEPLLREMVESVLPQVAAENFGALLLEELDKAAAAQMEIPVDLIVAPCNRAALKSILPEDLEFVLHVVEETTLGEGQAFIRVGRNERQIDLMEVLDRASKTVSGFFEINQKVATNERQAS